MNLFKIIIFIIFLFFLITNPITFYFFHEINNLFMDCGYYEDYTIEDIKNLNSNGDGYDLNNLSIDIFFIQYYKEGEHFDCNDYAFAKKCVYERNNYSCFTVAVRAFPKLNEDRIYKNYKIFLGSHIETMCFLNE